MKEKKEKRNRRCTFPGPEKRKKENTQEMSVSWGWWCPWWLCHPPFSFCSHLVLSFPHRCHPAICSSHHCPPTPLGHCQAPMIHLASRCSQQWWQVLGALPPPCFVPLLPLLSFPDVLALVIIPIIGLCPPIVSFPLAVPLCRCQ
jgi:hypothetical protein